MSNYNLQTFVIANEVKQSSPDLLPNTVLDCLVRLAIAFRLVKDIYKRCR